MGVRKRSIVVGCWGLFGLDHISEELMALKKKGKGTRTREKEAPIYFATESQTKRREERSL
jgi:hypothetical protein